MNFTKRLDNSVRGAVFQPTVEILN